MSGRPTSLFDSLREQGKRKHQRDPTKNAKSSSSPVTPVTESTTLPSSPKEVVEERIVRKELILPRKRYKSAGETSNLLSYINASDPNYKSILASFFPPDAFNKPPQSSHHSQSATHHPHSSIPSSTHPTQSSTSFTTTSLDLLNSKSSIPSEKVSPSESGEDGVKKTEKEATTPLKSGMFLFSNEANKAFSMSGKLEATMFTPTSHFIKLDSLLVKEPPPSQSTNPNLKSTKDCISPEGVKRNVGSSNKNDDDDSNEDESTSTSHSDRSFKVTSEQVTQQRMISVEREECHKKEHAVISLQKDSDVQQQRAVTVFRSNTWGCEDSLKKFKNISKFRKLLFQPGISEDAKDKLTDRHQIRLTDQNKKNDNEQDKHINPNKDGRVDINTESNRKIDIVTLPTSPTSPAGELKCEMGTLSDDSVGRIHTDRHSKALRHIVKSFSIIDKDFRCLGWVGFGLA